MNNRRSVSATSNNFSQNLNENYFKRNNLNNSSCGTYYSNNSRNEFFYAIFEWNPSWLYDDRYKNITPSIIESRIVFPTKLIYSNYQEYKNIMLPFIINELWHTLRSDISENKKIEKVEKKINIVCLPYIDIIESSLEDLPINNDKIIRFTLLVKFTYNLERFDDKYPSRGDLIILKNTYSDQLAFVEDVKRKYNPTDGMTLTFVLITKFPYSFQNMTLNKYWSLTTVTSISSNLTLVDALDKIYQSPLINSILQPTCHSFKLFSPINIISTFEGETLNPKQLEIMSQVVATVETRTAGICCIQGPPGTGKSTVIKNIIVSLLSRKRVGRILLCAPSNKAVDELVIKLLDIQQKIKDRGIPFQIVRVGSDDKIDDKVKCLSLTNLSSNRKGSASGNRKYQEIEERIIRSANVIACTLTSSRTNSRIQSVFGSREAQISFCVIDEAAQATELLTLLPTLLGIDRLILVGDPQQLPPTVLSQKAKEKGYDLSLFARAQLIFKGELQNPIVMLDTQYRMVDAISEWPNCYFYDRALKNAALVPSLDICNYKVINHSYPQSKDKHSNGFCNVKEAKLVVEIVRTTIKKIKSKNLDKRVSIGIITPYQNQCIRLKGLLSTLKNKIPSELVTIEINTVDSFQGSECDVIIFSCVRSNGIGFVENSNRLNVSLTRAKHTLVLCGNFRAFKRNEMWANLLNNAQSRGVYKDISNNHGEQLILNDVIDDVMNVNSMNIYDHSKSFVQFYNDHYSVFKIIIIILQVLGFFWQLLKRLLPASWNFI